jgi:Xaa-Pro aminopeptidase
MRSWRAALPCSGANDRRPAQLIVHTVKNLAPSSALHDRLARVRSTVRDEGGDGLLVTHLPNVAYLTNLFATAGALVVTADALRVVVDARYAETLRTLLRSPYGCRDAELVPVAATYDETIARVLADLGLARVLVESESMTIGRFHWLERTLANRPSRVELVAAERPVGRARVLKDAHEIALFRQAGALISDVAGEVLGEVRVGRTEREIAARVDFAVKTAGFERPAFDTIVAAGERSALPHARPTDRVVGADELVVLDFGGVYGGYCVDLTRTVYTGTPTDQALRVFEAVRSAHADAVAAVRPGIRGWDVDAVARRRLTDCGLGEAFTHGTGHGLGLEIHEEPRIVQRRTDVLSAPGSEPLAAGMVFTIEPGAYLPQWGGVRIEDDVLVTEHGVERLTNVPIALEAERRR